MDVFPTTPVKIELTRDDVWALRVVSSMIFEMQPDHSNALTAFWGRAIDKLYDEHGSFIYGEPDDKITMDIAGDERAAVVAARVPKKYEVIGHLLEESQDGYGTHVETPELRDSAKHVISTLTRVQIHVGPDL